MSHKRHSRLGSKHTPETILKMKASRLRLKLKNGFLNSPDTREKMARSRTGKKATIETIYKKSIAQMGERGSNWRGGLTSESQVARSSFKYKVWRKSVFQRDNYTCQSCGQRGGELNADHIKPFALFKELRFELSNGRTLCHNCHTKTDTYGYGTRKKIEEFERLIK